MPGWARYPAGSGGMLGIGNVGYRVPGLVIRYRVGYKINGSGAALKFRITFLCLAATLSPATVACPIGMQFNRSVSSPPYEYTGRDLMRGCRAAITAMALDEPEPFKRSVESAANFQKA